MQPSHTRQEQGSARLLLTVDEAAEQLRVSRWTLQRLVQERRLASVTIGARRLIALDDLERFIEANRVGSEEVHHGL